MSEAISAIGSAFGLASLLFTGSRSITGAGDVNDENGNPVSPITVIPDLAIRERHRDALGITAQPVQKGAAITDHAYKLPAELELEYGWSNSSIQALTSDFTNSTSITGLMDNFGEGYVRQVYQTLLQLQESRQLCTIVTGKRLYKNMLIAEVSTETTADTAYSMFVTCRCVEVFIVSTQTASVGVLENQKNPADTASVQKGGTRALIPVANPPQSLLSVVFGGVSGLASR
ncbi:phage baseplate protein [Asaia bogorensis]|uniref:phage baseplate protein n=1 Tax=Asaia bogorensis TaxID=91915 RepID=UPI0028640E6A|nr:hypothetical protein [Asaia bogorensis]MDR6182045.1 hypothetical protein [Asaia bogorensis NBRC 16594]